jgi:hypothetical protein
MEDNLNDRTNYDEVINQFKDLIDKTKCIETKNIDICITPYCHRWTVNVSMNILEKYDYKKRYPIMFAVINSCYGDPLFYRKYVCNKCK